jgi:hypothetical protein
MKPNEKETARAKVARLADTVRTMIELIDAEDNLDSAALRKLASNAKDESQAVIGYTRVVDRRARKAAQA